MAARIAVLSLISWRTPPRAYGPWEFVVSLLTEELVRMGLDVALFASGDSQTSGKLIAARPRPYSGDPRNCSVSGGPERSVGMANWQRRRESTGKRYTLVSQYKLF